MKSLQRKAWIIIGTLGISLLGLPAVPLHYGGAQDLEEELCESIPPSPLPNPVITDTKFKVEVSFNPSNGVYTYSYSINSGSTNLGEIPGFSVDIVTKGTVDPSPDPDLTSDDSFIRENFAPTRTIPVGLESPEGWAVGVGITGVVGWGITVPPFPLLTIIPGQTMEGFIIRAKAPPGPRKFEIDPVFDTTCFPADAEFRTDLPQPDDYTITGETIGPVLPVELALIDGKGQRSDVNAFLRYSNPTKTTVTLLAGVKTFELAVFYGSTIDPASFRADLNREIITPKFTASPGGFSVVRLDLKEGRNTLVLSVDGVRSDGRTGRDTDRLTFIVPAP